jgi:hypothetical protein
MEIDASKLRRALRRLIDRRNRLRDAFDDQIKRDASLMDEEELSAIRTAVETLTPDQHHLIERALEIGFRLGQPDADRGEFIFIAYARADAETAALGLCNELSENGVRCFIDKHDIPAGADWNEAIVEALGQCAAVIVLISNAAVESGYLKSEVQAAFDQQKLVIPVALDSAASPERIDNRLRTRMITGADDAPAMARLVERLRVLF